MDTNLEDLHEETERNQIKMRKFRKFFHETLFLAEKKALDKTWLLEDRRLFGLDKLKSLNCYRVFVV